MRIYVSAKCSDCFGMSEVGGNHEAYDGYVPEWFPDEHYGDYIMLEIDTKTGTILNWPKGLKDTTVRMTFKQGRK